MNVLQYLSSEDISRMPDQASYKINRIIEQQRLLPAYIYPVGSYLKTSDQDYDPNKAFPGMEWESTNVGSDIEWHRVA